MKKFIITQDQVKIFMEYLGQRPYNEVHMGVEMLNNLPEHPEKKKSGEVKAPPVKK